MLTILKKLHTNQSGSYFVEMALVLIGVALAYLLRPAALLLTASCPSTTAYTTEISNMPVPNLP